MVRRRALLIMLVIAAGCAVSVWYALSLQHLYRSTEVIQVAQPRISDDLAKSTVEGSAARRLQLIEQRLMARDSVLEMIVRYGLYADMPGLSSGERVAMLRRAVHIEGIAAAREGVTDDGSMSVLTVSADMPTPLQAQKVAHEIAQRTVELSRENRIEQARETLEFLTVREQALADEIAALEAEVADYHRQHDLALPGSTDFRRAEIATLNDGLLAIARERIAIQRAADQIDDTQRRATADRLRADFAEQLATLDAQRQLLQDRKTELERSIETSPDVERQLGAYDRKLAQLRGQLDQITERRSEAEVGFRLETDRQSERLTVIEPAVVPEFPITGSRKKIAVLGGGMSVLIALLLAFAMELRKPAIRSAAQMERELGILPVVTIPVMKTGRRRSSLFRRRSHGGQDRFTA